MKLCRFIGVCAALITLGVRAVTKKQPHLRAHGNILRHIGADQRRVWSLPVSLVSGRYWKPALLVIAATAILIVLDPIVAGLLSCPWFRNKSAVRSFNRVFSARNMALLINAVPLLANARGLLPVGSYAGRTGLLAGEAAASAEIVAMVMKYSFRRLRPIHLPAGGNHSQTWFRTKNRGIDIPGGFPSGHTASAFAMATLFAERYPGRTAVPCAAFGLAGIVAVSRLTTGAHFLSDVCLGAFLGYSIGHFVVMPRDRIGSTTGSHLTAEG